MRAVDWLRRSQWKLHATVLNGRYFLCARCCYFYSYSFSHGNPDLTEDQNTYVCTFKRVRTDSSMCDGYGICSYDVCVIEFCDSTSESVILSPVSARQSMIGWFRLFSRLRCWRKTMEESRGNTRKTFHSSTQVAVLLTGHKVLFGYTLSTTFVFNSYIIDIR